MEKYRKVAADSLEEHISNNSRQWHQQAKAGSTEVNRLSLYIQASDLCGLLGCKLHHTAGGGGSGEYIETYLHQIVAAIHLSIAFQCRLAAGHQVDFLNPI